jgi:hypothetical protein
MSFNNRCSHGWKGLRNMPSVTRCTLSGVRAGDGHVCGLQSATDPSGRRFDTHNSRVFVARNITTLELRSETTLCRRNRVCFDKSTAAVRC